MKQLKLSFLITSFALIMGTAFYAEAYTLSTNAKVQFLTPLTIVANTLPNFGNVLTGASGRVLTLSTTGTISGTNAGDYINKAAAGNYTIAGSTHVTVNISIGNYVANNGVTPSAASCAYNGGAVSSPCNLVTQAAPGTGKPLLVGLTMTTTAVSTDGQTATPGFDIVVTYN